jgi:CBS domain-containing protein
MAKLVRDLMHRGVLTCRPDATLGQVAVLLQQHHVHSLIVTDRDGRPLGVITDFDLLAAEWLSVDKESMTAMRKMTAGELMSTPINMIEADAPFSEAAERMRAREIRRLLVTEKGKPVGIISVSDYVANLVEKIPFRYQEVGYIMTEAILVCRDKTPVVMAAKSMTNTGWRSVIVVDAAGKLLGVVSGMDLLAACGMDDDCSDLTVDQVMHPALTIDIHASLQEAASKMIENHHHRLVVVDATHPDEMPLGMVSSVDIVSLMAHPDSIWQKKL